MLLDRCTLLLFSAFLSGAATSVATSQVTSQAETAQTGEIRIRTNDTTGHAVTAQGRLSGPTGWRSRSVETAQDGSLTVPHLAFGRYTLTLAKSGFVTLVVNVEVLSQIAVTRELTFVVAGLATTVNVISATPIGSLDVSLADVPLPVQTVSAKTIEDTNALDLTDVLKKRLNGVYVNENQNNPFQPDVNYRGYTASPLVGSTAGLSVYLDGVRQNQPFGDVVSWDLIPKIAIASTELIPGSNPVYGLNTLGGAIAVQTKSGLTNSGFAISGYGGSFGRRAVEAQYGGSNATGLNWFVGGTLFHEDGWRVHSPSSVKQSFAKLGYTRANTVLSLSGGYAINSLTGNGTQDFRTINRTTGLNFGYNSVYSLPDVINQHSPFVTLNGTLAISNSVTFSANAYLRYTRTNTSNGDINTNSFDQSLYTLSASDKAALTAAGISFPTTAITPANTPFPFLLCIAQGLQRNEPGEKCTGVDTDTANKQNADGFSGVVSWRTSHSRLAVGAGLDRGSLTYKQTGQYGYLNTDGVTITRIPTFLDGTTNVNDVPQDTRVNLHGTSNTPDLFLIDIFTVGKWVLTAAGRYNHTNVNNIDRLPPIAYRGTLTAVNVFQRFNPSAGVVYKTSGLLHAYFNYGESSRAPTSTELGCADPNFPCSLPNALVSDPPLRQVVSRTYEFGVRGNPDGQLRWTAGYFHSNNYDDLLFVAAQQTGYGNFQNFGQTRRQGVEANVSSHLRKLDTGAEYTFLSATYESSQTINSGSNSSNSNALAGLSGVTDGGTILIRPGNHIPQIPQNLLKLYGDFHPLLKLAINGDISLIGSAYVRGNENNLHMPNGVTYLGCGKSPGYGVVNIGTRYTFNSHYEFFVQVNNLLNRRYYTAGQLASTPYDANGSFSARPFAVLNTGDYAVRHSTYLSPGAPITVFGGMKVSFGRK
jgi:outer membrane receptor protein involved in Fe transport